MSTTTTTTPIKTIETKKYLTLAEVKEAIFALRKNEQIMVTINKSASKSPIFYLSPDGHVFPHEKLIFKGKAGKFNL
jgi:hypothetical protein